MKSWLIKYFSVVRMTWIQTLEYKANALVGTFAIFSGLFIEFLIWKQVFQAQNINEIRGFTFNGLMVYIFLCMIVGQLKSSWATSMEMIDSIRTGELNKYLIRPISFFTYHFMMFIGHNSLFYIVYTIVIILFPILIPGWCFHTKIQIVGFIISLGISIYLSYTIYFCMVCFAFWFGEVRSLVIAYNIANSILSGQIIPLRLFPEGAREIIFLTPIQYLVDFPVSIATGNLPIEFWIPKMAMALLWCCIITITGRILYGYGIRAYGGFGA
tara:strand:+ start:826 stop:1635 length:810 start_codon:yes stop_codon:yes gene_type:complete